MASRQATISSLFPGLANSLFFVRFVSVLPQQITALHRLYSGGAVGASSTVVISVPGSSAPVASALI
jgi:hypothetical protein